MNSPLHSVESTCPECGTPVTATIDFLGREISCPACLATISIPKSAASPNVNSGSETLATPPPPAAKTEAELPILPDVENDDSYRVAFFGSDTKAPPADEIPLAEIADEEPAAETFTLKKSTGRSDAANEAMSYTLGHKVERPAEKIEVFKALSHVKHEKRPPPPKSLFFTNVFQFPWSSLSSLVRWTYLSAGLTCIGFFLGVCVWLMETSGSNGWLGVGFLMMGIVWFGLLSLSFAAALSMAIVGETAAGMDQIEGWGEGGWRDWLFDFVLLLWIYVFAGFACMPIAYPLRSVVGYLSPQLLILQFFVFPAIWLSAMDAESVWIPFSTIVFASFRRIPGTWSKFYGLTFALLASSAAIIAGATYVSHWLGGLLGGPIVASVIFIYSRLLGRLGYAIICEMEKPAAKKGREQETLDLKPAAKAEPSKKKKADKLDSPWDKQQPEKPAD